MNTPPEFSVLIPAHNEASEITGCLAAVFASDPFPKGATAEVLVLANGCSDDTAQRARAHPVPAGWTLNIVEIENGGKLNALNIGDTKARGRVLAYLDADVRVSPALLTALFATLNHDTPAYASGHPDVLGGASWISRTYGRLWVKLPFVASGVPGFGLFAMNRAGRERWSQWPEIIADDTYARLMFTPAERHKVSDRYQWPLVQGFRNLVKVRRRQDQGVKELEELYPALIPNDDKTTPSMAQIITLFRQDVLGFAVYALVSLAVKSPLFRNNTRWARGR